MQKSFDFTTHHSTLNFVLTIKFSFLTPYCYFFLVYFLDFYLFTSNRLNCLSLKIIYSFPCLAISAPFLGNTYP